jgi:hypothetical protein
MQSRSQSRLARPPRSAEVIPFRRRNRRETEEPALPLRANLAAFALLSLLVLAGSWVLNQLMSIPAKTYHSSYCPDRLAQSGVFGQTACR